MRMWNRVWFVHQLTRLGRAGCIAWMVVVVFYLLVYLLFSWLSMNKSSWNQIVLSCPAGFNCKSSVDDDYAKMGKPWRAKPSICKLYHQGTLPPYFRTFLNLLPSTYYCTHHLLLLYALQTRVSSVSTEPGILPSRQSDVPLPFRCVSVSRRPGIQVAERLCYELFSPDSDDLNCEHIYSSTFHGSTNGKETPFEFHINRDRYLCREGNGTCTLIWKRLLNKTLW